MRYLRQGTAAVVPVGPFNAVADGNTPITNLTAASTLNARAVSGGSGAPYTPASFTHDANGHYLAGLAADDVPAVGPFRLSFCNPAEFCSFWEDFEVLSPAVYDSLFGAVALSTYAGGGAAIDYAAMASAFAGSGGVPANVIALAGSGQAADNLRDDELATPPTLPAADSLGRVTVAPAGANAVPGMGSWSLPQTIRMIGAMIFGKRTGVPAAGLGGTVTIQDDSTPPVAYGTITYDAGGNVTAVNLSPPA